MSYLKEYIRLTGILFEQDMPNGNPADLTPIKNKAREAAEALVDAQRACDSGRSEDAIEAMRRARAVIDAALGSQLGVHGAAMPANSGSYGSGGYGGF